MTDTISVVDARQLFARYGDAAGLLLDAVGPVTAKAGPVIYVCDVITGRVVLLETVANALQQVSEQANLDEATYERLRQAFCVLFDDLFANQEGVHPDTRRGVIFGASFCISETRGFNITKHHGNGVQHALVRYPNAANKQYVLTPMPLFKSHPIPVDELNAAVNHILLSEQLNYPERFVSQVAVGFKQRRRNVLSGK